MKKFLLAAAALAFVSLTVSSCSNECVSCTGCDTNADMDICMDDYDNVEVLYDAAVESYRADNCECL